MPRAGDCYSRPACVGYPYGAPAINCPCPASGHDNFQLFVFLLIAALCPTMCAQDRQTQERFAGTWEAKFKGAVICTINLEAGETI
jgi:hypothetical protein